MERKRIVWTAEKANRIYDYESTCPPREQRYFCYQVGVGVVDFCLYFVPDISKTNVLDYGCGMGHLLGRFMERGINVYGADMSPNSVDSVNKKYAGNPLFHGVTLYGSDGRLPFQDETFEMITCVCVIEHILPEHMDQVLSEIYRVLKRGGRAVFITDNEENMAMNEYCCPECNTIFHKSGHVSSFTSDSLRTLLEKYGFQTLLCKGMDFWHFQKYLIKKPLADMSLNQIRRAVKWKITGWLDRKNRYSTKSAWFQKNMNLKRRPHLTFVGTK